MLNIVIGSFFFFTGLFVFLTKKSSIGLNLAYGTILFSTVQLVGLNGASFIDGLSVMAWELLATVGLIFFTLYFLPRFLKNGINTVPEFFEIRFDQQTRILVERIFLGAYTIILLPTILYTGAIGLMGILDLQSETFVLWPIIWTIGTFGSIYALFGGQKSFKNFGNLVGIGLLIGVLLITYLGLEMVSEGKGIYEGWLLLQIYAPEKFNPIGNPNQSVPFGTLFSGVLLLNLFYWFTNQQFIQRTLGAKDLAEGQKGVLLVGSLKLLGPLYLVLPGIIAFHFFGDKGISPDKAFGMLVNKVLPPFLIGGFAAVMVGAILSIYSSALNSALGFNKNILNSGKKRKIFGLSMAFISMVIAPFLTKQTSIFFYLQKINGIFFIPIFAVIVMGMLFKHIPPIAAKLALLLGLMTISFGYFIPINGSHYITDYIHEFHFLGLVFIALMAIMFFIGWIYPMEKGFVQSDVRDGDLRPWKYTSLVSASLIFLVFLIYYLFSEFSFKNLQLEFGSVFLVVLFLIFFKALKIFFQRINNLN